MASKIKNITKKLRSVITFWFPDNSFQDYWFSSERDTEIKINYKVLLEIIEELDEINIYNAFHNDFDLFQAVVITLDQFSRNIYRSGNFRKNDEKCFNLVVKYLTHHPIDNIPYSRRIFMYLPFRHQRKTKYLDYVMKKITVWESQDLTPNDANIIRRFKKATLSDYSKVTDSITKSIDDWQTPFDEIRENLNILDTNCHQYPSLNRSKWVIVNYFSPQLDPTFSTKKVIDSNLYQTVHKFIMDNFPANPAIGLSLSGGVDSMVISLILKTLHNQGVISQVICMHVDYMNRDVSTQEATFVERWCQFLKIPLYTRRVTHMKRNSDTEISGKVDRAFYESETKKCRFNLYKYCIEKYSLQGIMLGHHSDDRAENVLMNIFRGKDILNLFVMTDISINNGVTICRPLISNTKTQIFDFAHKFQIPYLANTTSEKCYRHLMRNKIFPAIQDFDPTIVDNINLTGIRSNEWNTAVNKQIIIPMLKSITDLKYGFYLEWKESYDTLSMTCWQNIFAEIFHTRGIHMTSKKSLKTILGWFRRKNGFQKTTNGYTMFFYKQYLYFGKSDLLSRFSGPINTNISIEKSPDQIFSNGWEITITELDTGDTTLRNNRIPIDTILDGYFTMYSKYSSTMGKLEYNNGGNGTPNYRSFRGNPISKFIPKIHLEKGEKMYLIEYRYR